MSPVMLAQQVALVSIHTPLCFPHTRAAYINTYSIWLYISAAIFDRTRRRIGIGAAHPIPVRRMSCATSPIAVGLPPGSGRGALRRVAVGHLFLRVAGTVGDGAPVARSGTQGGLVWMGTGTKDGFGSRIWILAFHSGLSL